MFGHGGSVGTGAGTQSVNAAFDLKEVVASLNACALLAQREWPGARRVSRKGAQVDQARNLLVGMLGHDMRSPLPIIQMTAVYLAALNAGEKVSGAASRLINSGARRSYAGAFGRYA